MSNKPTVTTEIEKKYVIFIPDEEIMSSMPEYSRSEIVQTYLISDPGQTHRVRARTANGVTVYTETRKIRIDGMSATEIESEISHEQYTRLLKLADSDRTPIEKVRHAFLYLGQLFEIDVYPLWRSSCIMETELAVRDTKVEFPPFISVIKDVTGERKYSNASMAREFPPELTLTL